MTFLDSTAICELVRAHAALADVGRSLVVAAPSPAATRIFGLTGLLGTFMTASDQR